jgi:TRAP-type mannitol/chloroaromatic compound transport system permease large subunit
MAIVKRKLSFSLLKQAVESTAVMTSFVMFILVGSTVFSLVFRGLNGDLWVEHLLSSLPGGALGFLIVVNVMIFLLAFFLDYFEIAFIMVPLLTPVAHKLGIDIVWFGVLLAVNMQTSFLHPPFGFALFYLRSVAPASVKTMDIYWGAVPFVVIQVAMVAVIIAFPAIVTGNVSKASGAISGSGADELRRQIEAPRAPPEKDSKSKEPAPPAEDTGSELERLLKQR